RAWEVAEGRAMSTSPDDPPDKRNADAVAILGTFEGEPLDAWVADIKRAGIADSSDARVVIPLLAAVHRATPGEARRVDDPRPIHGATLAVVNRLDSHLIADGSRVEIDRLHDL